MKTKLGKIEVVMNQFECITKTTNSETKSTCYAIFKASYDSRYRLIVDSVKYENGKIKSTNKVTIYYNTYDELKKEYLYHYELCKNNLLTKQIKIKK